MKKICILMLLAMPFMSIAQATNEKNNTVNPVLGDISFVETFGDLPVTSTNGQTRIITHLAYVEKKLQEQPVTHLTPLQKQNRALVLALLHSYRVAGNFPKNYDYPEERKPCFIDKDGNICAVGYLIEKTIGRDAAEQINQQYQYSEIKEMDQAVIQQWATQYGLTVEECAMIQPTYGYPNGTNSYVQKDIKPAYGISSGIIGGANAAFTIINIVQLQNGRQHTMAPLAGLVTGTAQILTGALNIKKQEVTYYINAPSVTTTYKAQNNLSYANIAMGTTTLITSAWNLLRQRNNKNPKNHIGLYSYPTMGNSVAMGFTFTKRM